MSPEQAPSTPNNPTPDQTPGQTNSFDARRVLGEAQAEQAAHERATEQAASDRELETKGRSQAAKYESELKGKSKRAIAKDKAGVEKRLPQIEAEVAKLKGSLESKQTEIAAALAENKATRDQLAAEVNRLTGKMTEYKRAMESAELTNDEKAFLARKFVDIEDDLKKQEVWLADARLSYDAANDIAQLDMALANESFGHAIAAMEQQAAWAQAKQLFHNTPANKRDKEFYKAVGGFVKTATTEKQFGYLAAYEKAAQTRSAQTTETPRTPSAAATTREAAPTGNIENLGTEITNLEKSLLQLQSNQTDIQAEIRTLESRAGTLSYGLNPEQIAKLNQLKQAEAVNQINIKRHQDLIAEKRITLDKLEAKHQEDELMRQLAAANSKHAEVVTLAKRARELVDRLTHEKTQAQTELDAKKVKLDEAMAITDAQIATLQNTLDQAQNRYDNIRDNRARRQAERPLQAAKEALALAKSKKDRIPTLQSEYATLKAARDKKVRKLAEARAEKQSAETKQTAADQEKLVIHEYEELVSKLRELSLAKESRDKLQKRFDNLPAGDSKDDLQAELDDLDIEINNLNTQVGTTASQLAKKREARRAAKELLKL